MKGSNINKIVFPRAFAFSIDDLGWNEGSNLSKNVPPGPVRVGIKRTFDLQDYKYIVDVAKAVGVRIQCLFVLCEMDRENVLAKYPTTTQQRGKWDNTHRVRDEQLDIMNYVLSASSHMEFGLHGTGHEYWADDGIQRRAEWYNLIDREPWPEEILMQHIQGFREIMAQYGFTPRNGHTFPESFVACAYGYYWNPDGDYSLGKVLSQAGVKYANTDFGQIPELSPPQEVNGGGFDFGTHVINRMNYGNHYYDYDSLPKVPVEMQGTDIIESHWANWLASDDVLQPEVITKFINYYRDVQRLTNRYIAKNTEQLHSQWLYRKYTGILETEPGIVEIDNTRMPDDAYRNDILGNLVLKLKLDTSHHVTDATINGNLIPAYFEEEGFAFLYLPPLGKKKYKLQYRTGTTLMPLHVYNDGTYNVYGLSKTESQILITLKMYGRQTVKIRCCKPEKVISANDGLVLESYTFLPDQGMLHIMINATNMQGTLGEIKLMY
jgi:hypothetical protein